MNTATESPTPSIYDVFRHGQTTSAKPIDLTIGNPHLKPPRCYYDALDEVVRELKEAPGNGHGYATGTDPFGLCARIAEDLTSRFGAAFSGSEILPTVGATCALDIAVKTLASYGQARPAEFVMVAPHFVEYVNIVRGNGAKPVVAESGPDFRIDVESIAAAIGPHTRALILNSPNNPTGRIYSEESLRALADALEAKNREFGIRVAVIEDAVYESIVFGGRRAPSMIPFYPTLLRVNSYSKSLSISGERLGYLAVHPGFLPDEARTDFVAALNLNMRMRVVHAPLLQQRIVARMPLHGLVDIEAYHRNVERLHLTLNALGFGVGRPEGTFYLWAVLPDEFRSEAEFRALAFEGPSPLLYLPGTLFGGDAYARCVRFSTCAPFAEIERACVRLREIVEARRPNSGATP